MLSAGALLLWSDVGPLLTSTSYLSNLHDTVTVSTLLYFRWRMSRARTHTSRPSGTSADAKWPTSDGNQSDRASAKSERGSLPLAVPLLVLAFQLVVQLGAPLYESPKEPGTIDDERSFILVVWRIEYHIGMKDEKKLKSNTYLVAIKRKTDQLKVRVVHSNKK